MPASEAQRWTHVEQLEAEISRLSTELALARAERDRLRRELDARPAGTLDPLPPAPAGPAATPTASQLAVEAARRARDAAQRLRDRHR